MKRKHILLLISLISVIAAGCFTYTLLSKDSSPKPAQNSSQIQANNDIVVVDRSALPAGWETGPKRATDALIFQHAKDCFVSGDYKNNSGEDTNQSELARLTADQKVEPLAVVKLQLRLKQGSLAYDLQPYRNNNPENYPASAFANISATNAQGENYSMRLIANCKNPNDMPEAYQALQAITLNR